MHTAAALRSDLERLGVRAGDVVMSGSISALIRPAAGDTVAAAFTRLGRVEARFGVGS